MFSSLPVRGSSWSAADLRYLLCAFPLIGAAVGGCCWAWTALCGALGLPALLRGAGLCLLPVWLTGGIHLDGFADTCDALASNRGPAEMRSILKDPHLGSFACIRLCCVFVLSFALFSALPDTGSRTMAWLLAGFCLSRALSGFAIAVFRIAPGDGLARTFSDTAEKILVRRILAAEIAVLCGFLCFSGIGGLWMTAAAGVVFIRYRSVANNRFEGISGDLAGWFLVRCETAMLAALTAEQFLEASI